MPRPPRRGRRDAWFRAAGLRPGLVERGRQARSRRCSSAKSVHRQAALPPRTCSAPVVALLVQSSLVTWAARSRARRAAGDPLVVVLFKIAGLYDRDELRLVHSTLDEVPLLLQLTGLFALCVTIARVRPGRGDARRRARSPRCGSARSRPSSAAACSRGRLAGRDLAERALPGDRGARARRAHPRALRSSRAHATVVASLPLTGTRPRRARQPREHAPRRLRAARAPDHPRAATTDTSDVAELIRDRQGGRRPRERAAAHVRGRRRARSSSTTSTG